MNKTTWRRIYEYFYEYFFLFIQLIFHYVYYFETNNLLYIKNNINKLFSIDIKMFLKM